MFDSQDCKDPLVPSDYPLDNFQQHLAMLRVRIWRQKLKEEKSRDKLVYQSIKDKISTY